jgi:hypothetical protein
MRQTHVVAVIVVTLLSFNGCTDRGGGLLGAGPDDRIDRGTGPDTLAVVASADTYFERTVDDGDYLLFGNLNSEDFEAHSLIKFGNLPASAEGLEGVSLLLYVVADKSPYNFTISRLEEPAPTEYPFWPFPGDGEASWNISDASAVNDPKAPVEIAIVLKAEIPTEWVAGWIEDPSSNHGLRLSGGTIDVSGSGQVDKRFWSGGHADEGFVFGPRLEIAKAGQDTTRRVSTSDIYIFGPSIENPVGGRSNIRVGGVYGYEALLRFPLGEFPFDSSVNKALLYLKVDRSVPDLNHGIFDVVVRAVVGSWEEDSTNVNVELDPASTLQVEVDAADGGDDLIEIDITAMVDVFAEGEFFDIALKQSGLFSHNDKVALLSTETVVQEDAPFLRVLFTTPPGRRY